MKETKTEYTINGTEFEQVIADNGITQTITSRQPGMPTAAEIIAEPAGRRMDKWVAKYVLKIDGKRAEMYSRNTISALYVLDQLDTVIDNWQLSYFAGAGYELRVTIGMDGALGEGDTKALAICRALLTLFCVEIQ